MQAVAAYFGKQVLREVRESDFLAALPELRKTVPDRAILRAMHYFREDRRVRMEVMALRNGCFEAFLELVQQSGQSSCHYLQNITPAGAGSNQPVALALALCDSLLKGRGAFRVHGGGFAGTVQAFVPFDLLEECRRGIDRGLGPGSCRVLTIRQQGAGRTH